MAISDLPGTITATDVGPVFIELQGGRTVYVRGGLDDLGDRIPEATRAPLDAGRGALVSFRGHYKLRGGEWVCPQPFIHRVDQQRGKDPSRAMVSRVVGAVREAIVRELDTDAGRTALQLAAYAASSKAAAERTAVALRLRETADQLDREASALMNGGRVTYRRVWFNDRGASVSVQQIELRDGTLLDPVLAPPNVYGAREWPWTNIKTNEETD